MILVKIMFQSLFGNLLNHLYHYANENVSAKHLSLICITSILTTIYSLKNGSVYGRSCRIYNPKSFGLSRTEFHWDKKKLCFFWLRVGLYSEKLLQRPCLRPRVTFLSPRYSFSLYGPPSPNNIYWCHVIGTWTEIGFLRCGTWQIKRLRISFSLFSLLSTPLILVGVG